MAVYSFRVFKDGEELQVTEANFADIHGSELLYEVWFEDPDEQHIN